MKYDDITLFNHIESGTYFIDARKWYGYKYTDLLVQRTYLLISVLIILTAMLITGFFLYFLFPLNIETKYLINSNNIFKTTAQVIKADIKGLSPIESISSIMIQNYVQQREQYNFDKLPEQLSFIQNNSNKKVYKNFTNYMDINNALSPVLRYQQMARRSVSILNLKYISDNQVVILFQSKAKTISGEEIESITWQADVNFIIDPISLDAQNQTKFNFTITDYKIKLLEDKTTKS